jgi:hypothetical protein
MLNIITEHDVHKNHRVFELVSHVIDKFLIYKISADGSLSKKLVLERYEPEDYDLYEDCGRLLYLRKEFTRYSDRAISINNSNYVNLTEYVDINRELLAVRNKIFSDNTMQNENNSDLEKEICNFLKKIYDIIKLTCLSDLDDFVDKTSIYNYSPFNVYKIAYENDNKTISLYYEFQCSGYLEYLLNNSWFVDSDLSSKTNKVWTYASRYMSRILKDDISVNNLDELQYYAQIYQTRNY